MSKPIQVEGIPAHLLREPMTEREAFRAAIAKDCNAALIYGDWLEERGQPRLDAYHWAVICHPQRDEPRLWYAEACGSLGRAEFIKAQCRIAQMDENGEGQWPEDGHTCYQTPCPICVLIEEYQRLKKCEEELLLMHWPAWTAGCKAGYCMNLYTGRPFTPPNTAITFSRGWISRIELPLAAFMEHAGAIFRSQPVTSVVLSDRAPLNLGWINGGGYAYTVPFGLWEHLTGWELATPTNKRYTTLDQAYAALSRAACAHGRELAGLPRLED